MKALAFDLFGTLVDLRGLEGTAAKATKHAEEFVAAWRSIQLDYTFQLGLMGRYLPFSELTARALTIACAREGIEPNAETREALLRSWRRLSPFPDARPALESMKGKMPLAVLTNADPSMAAETLKGAKLDGLFAHVLSADEVRSFKPNPRVYRLAGVRLHLDPRDIGLVSANPFDVMGAKAAGLRAIWMNRAHAAFDPLDLPPDLIVEDFAFLAKQI